MLQYTLFDSYVFIFELIVVTLIWCLIFGFIGYHMDAPKRGKH